MTSSNKKQPPKLSCKCHYCCLTPLINHHPNSLDHQNSTNITTNSSTFQYDFGTATISSLYPQTHFTNPEALPALQQSFKRFTTAFPQYLDTVECDQIRANDFPHLSKNSHVCLDYSGHGLFSSSSKQGHFEVSNSRVHEHHSSVELTLESKIKRRISKYLNVSEDDYSLFFTANQTSALRIVAESYPFKTNKNFVTVYDHENEAIETMLETSRNNGARVSTAEFKWPKFKIHCKKLEEILLGNGNSNNKKKNKMKKGLFVFPIQSRISGVKYSYQWMNFARENGWHVLLDATSLGPKDMDTLGLSLFQPDFLLCTFYKVFGDDPSGFSCLLVKKSGPLVLDQSYFLSGRGTVALVAPGREGVDSGDQQTSGQQSEITENEECCIELVLGYVDSNLDNHQTLGQQSEITKSGECYVECKALDHADSLGLALISTRTRCLVNWLANALLALNHPRSDKDVELIQVYGHRVRFDRGPSLAFNVFDWKSEMVDPLLVQKLADRYNISLGFGCLKHVWFSERYEAESNKVMDKKSTKGGIMKIFEGKKREKVKNEINVVMVSIGYLTNFEDVYRVWEFVAKFLDADFVEKERWRYKALNQKIINV